VNQPFRSSSFFLGLVEEVEISSGSEGLPLGAEDEHAHFLRRDDFAHGIADRVNHLDIENVAPFRAVEADFRNTIGLGEKNRRGHGVPPQSLRLRPSSRSSTVRADSRTLVPGPKIAATPCCNRKS